MNLASSALALAFSAALMSAQNQMQPQKPVISSPVAPVKAETVHDVVASYFSDIPIMIAVSGCESHFKQFNTDGDVYRGEINHKDVGVMQINEGYHLDTAQSLGINIYTIEGNLAYARYLYDHEGTAPWSSSQYCWDKPSAKANAKVAAAKATKQIATSLTLAQ